MTYDIVIFVGDSLLDLQDPATPLIQFSDVQGDVIPLLTHLVEREERLSIILIPHIAQEG